MSSKKISLEFEEYADDKSLDQESLQLLNEARAATKNAYAPYSNFCVAAAALLSNKNLAAGKQEIITATNQENASFPAGICAERVLLSAIASQFPNATVDAIAISYDNKNGESNHPISPCGICRQSLVEFERRYNHPIKIILAGKTGKVYIIKSAADLLPLAFNSNDLLSK
ncbi:MAG TPA: cytidine deaminase [Parafilimonas sp.]|nr:cytidine deaminase [Parafilimonas sp.]